MDGIGSFLSKLKKAFSGNHEYHYDKFTLKGRAIRFISSNKKPASFMFLSVVAVASLYLVTSSITGFVTYTEDIESKLNETATRIDVLESEKEQCENDLQGMAEDLENCMSRFSSSLQECKQEITVLEGKNDELSYDLSSCEAERTEAEDKYEKVSADFETLVKNSVWDVCCSPYDVVNSNINDWGLTDNRIICGSGGYTINCGTGETSY